MQNVRNGLKPLLQWLMVDWELILCILHISYTETDNTQRIADNIVLDLSPFYCESMCHYSAHVHVAA